MTFTLLCAGMVAGAGAAAWAEEPLGSGTGVIKGTVALPAGVSPSQYEVHFESLNGQGSIEGPALNADGSFEIGALPSAELRAVIRERDANNNVVSAQVLETSSGVTVFSSKNGTTKHQAFEMKPMAAAAAKTATISGKVDVVGYQRIVISLYQLTGGKWQNLATIYDGSGLSAVNYTSPKLAAGTYTVYFTAKGGTTTDCALWWGNTATTCGNKLEKTIVVSAGQAKTGINMVIPRSWTKRPDPVLSSTTAKVGTRITATQADFTPLQERLTYQWYRTDPGVGWGLTPISGATSLSYTPTAADLGRELQLKTSVTKLKYLDAASYSEFVGPVTQAESVTPPPTPFKDVPGDHKFYEPIEWMASEGLSTGVKTSTGRSYQPKERVTREAMAAFLYRLEGAKDKGPKNSPFADVKPGDKFYNEIAWMHAQGLSTGVKTNSGRDYQPKAKVSREAMAAFIYRLEKAKTKAPKVSPFGDVKPGDKFYKEIAWMSTEGLSTGIKQSTGKPFYAPKAQVSREAMAAFLYRLEGK